MARAKVKPPLKDIKFEQKHLKSSGNGKNPISLKRRTKTAPSAESVTNSCSDLTKTITSLNQICESQDPKLSAIELIKASSQYQGPILSLLQSITCPLDKKHNIALKVPEIMLSGKDKSDSEISSKLVRDPDNILKWAVLSPEFRLKQRQHALQFLCKHLRNSSPKKKSLRIWTEHFFSEDCRSDGFRLDSVLTFGKSLPADHACSTRSKLLKALISMNEIGFARLLASESKMPLLDDCKEELSLQSKPLLMPADVKIVIVDNQDTALAAENILLCSPIVGVDTETQPQFKKGGRKNPVSIIQIATLSQVFIFDLLKALRICAPTVSKILRSPSVVKVGLGLRDDLVHLHSAYPDLNLGWATSIVDLNDMFIHKYPGASIKSLARLTMFCTGKHLQKSQQMSNWARRPLSDDQKHYASLDAFVCLQIASRLNNSDLTIEAIGETCRPFAKAWEYSISDDPGCMWVKPW